MNWSSAERISSILSWRRLIKTLSIQQQPRTTDKSAPWLCRVPSPPRGDWISSLQSVASRPTTLQGNGGRKKYHKASFIRDPIPSANFWWPPIAALCVCRALLSAAPPRPSRQTSPTRSTRPLLTGLGSVCYLSLGNVWNLWKKSLSFYFLGLSHLRIFVPAVRKWMFHLLQEEKSSNTCSGK